MAENNQTPDLTYGQHLRNQFWNPNQSTGRNIGSLAMRVLRSGGNPLALGVNALGGAAVANAREGVVNWHAFRRNQSPSAGSSPRPSTGAPLPSWMAPGASPTPSQPVWNPSTLPQYNDQTNAGPPSTSSGYGVLAPTPQGPAVNSQSPRTRNATTFLEGAAAQDYVRNLQMNSLGNLARGYSKEHERMISQA